MMSEKTLPITGRCQCGAVRYESDEPPTDSNYCHCRMCQRINGAPVVAAVTFARQAFRFTQGEPKYYKSSDFAERGFCANCGSSLVYRPLPFEDADSIFICTGTLDHPEDAPPTWHTGIESQVPWLVIDDDLPRMGTEDNSEVAAIKAAAVQDDE